MTAEPNEHPPQSDDRRANRPGLILLTSNWLSLVGMAVVITAASTWLFFLPAELEGHVENPYKGVFLYLIIPLIGACGIVLTVVGIVLGRRRIRDRITTEIVDRKLAWQRLALFSAITIGGNLLIGTQLTYRAVAYMDTPQFCGGACHVMQPEYVGHKDSNHASVACAECHIAPTAGGWIKAKMNGTRQLWRTLTRSYTTPIPSALESGRLVPAKQTCERCHWAEKIVATRLLVLPNYADDERNSDSYTVLMMLVGGSRMKGIHHAHFAGGYEIRYAATDAKRQTIPWVERRDMRTGETKTFLAAGTTPEQVKSLSQHVMQCVDCHDRPTHAFASPDRALNRALALGHLSPTLPFIKKQGLVLLQANYTSRSDAKQKITAALDGYYKNTHPDVYAQRKADVDAAGRALLAIYNRNFFPELKVKWDTYANNLGHTDFPGCFRCHDGAHTTSDGKGTIGQDCASCHQMLAVQQPEPEILKSLGVWDHIEALKARRGEKTTS